MCGGGGGEGRALCGMGLIFLVSFFFFLMTGYMCMH